MVGQQPLRVAQEAGGRGATLLVAQSEGGVGLAVGLLGFLVRQWQSPAQCWPGGWRGRESAAQGLRTCSSALQADKTRGSGPGLFPAVPSPTGAGRTPAYPSAVTPRPPWDAVR